MRRRRKSKARRLKARNPLVPVVRRLAPKVKASAKAYRRRPKHRRPAEENGGA